MINNLELKQQFITLRAKGYSLASIAKKIGKCRQTLSNWNSKFQEEIANAKAIEMESLFEECLITKQHRIKVLSKSLSKIDAELEKRNFSKVPDDKLLDLKLKILSHLKEEVFDPKIQSEEEINRQKEQRNLIDDL